MSETSTPTKTEPPTPTKTEPPTPTKTEPPTPTKTEPPTPTKTEPHRFIPIEIVTPSKDHQGITKTVYSHVSRLHVLLTEWSKMSDKGVRLFREIPSLKLYECLDDYYPSPLEPLMQKMLEILENLRNYLHEMRVLNEQLRALAKLQPGNEPVITTWSVSQISKSFSQIFQSAEKEFKLKEAVVENIAHCRDELLIDVYLSAWEYDVYFNVDTFAYLFAEVGLSSVP